jgi:hypothetical protein
MEHLSLETLARLVDDLPGPGEREHLAACAACAAELEALRRQTEALGSMPALAPAAEDWDVLEARLRSEGLVEDPGLRERSGLARTPGWMRAAAAAVLFLAGTGLGMALDRGGGAPLMAGSTPSAATPVAGAATAQEAAGAVRLAEERYVAALSRYRQLLAREAGQDGVGDPASRFAALEYLVAAGQAAVRQAPADPFLNGLLASTLAEREATLRTISVDGDGWF